MLRAILLLLCAALTLAPFRARAEATAWVGNAHAAARLITATTATGSASRVDAGLELRLAPGWHAYWRTPGDAGVPPSIDWKGSENLAGAAVAWPAPHRLVISGLQNEIYSGRVVLPLTLTLAHPGQTLHLHAVVDYAACAEICVPYHASFELVLPTGLAQPAPEAGLIAAARAQVPGSPAAAGLHLVTADVAPDPHGAVLSVVLRSTGAKLSHPDLFVEGLDEIAPGAPAVTLSNGGAVARLAVALPGLSPAKVAGRTLGFTLVDGTRAASFTAAPVMGAPAQASWHGWAGILVVALLGGLILNVMPCVLPVLSLKLLSVAAHAGQGRGRLRAGLLATAAGVVFSFGVLAAALVGLRAAGASIGWGIQFQQPWFLAFMALVTTLFAASLWDWLAIGLPTGRLATIHARHPWADAFLTGAFVTLLATPCSAPLVGTAVGFALSRGSAEIAAVFLVMGFGMAVPYLLVASMPGLARLLPRPGRWMVWLRRVFGLMLGATSLWLIWVLAQVAGRELAVAALVALVLLAAVLAVRSRIGAPSGVLAAALAAVALLVPSLAPPGAPAAPARTPDAVWRPADTAAIPALVGQGRVVVVDVTAAWCLTCKVNAAAVLDQPPIAARLRAPGVVAMRADWTRPDPAITAYLQRFGRYGVPMDVVYGPAHPEGIPLPELLTAGIVTAAMNRAAGPAAKLAAAR